MQMITTEQSRAESTEHSGVEHVEQSAEQNNALRKAER
jgi:hypothetical protein